MNIEAIEILEGIGLTSQESRVYLALLKLSESQSGILCNETGIASSNIYSILNSLIKKGLISYRVQNNIKVFTPSQPESLNNLFLEKQKSLEQEKQKIQSLIKSLKVQKPEKEPYSNYKYFEGILGVKSMWNQINSIIPTLNKKSIINIYAGKREAYESLLGYYEEYHKIRVKSKIKQKLILPFDEIQLAKKRGKQNVEVRFMDLVNEAEWGTIGDHIFFQYITTKTPRSFLIKDPIFAKTFEQVFEQAWKQAKP